MPTLSSHVSAHTTSSSKRDGADFEPDDEWKRQLKENIEESFKSMIQEAKDNQKAQVGIISQERLDWEYKQALQNIKGLAEEQYQLALMKERNERRWIAGVQMLPGWTDVLHDEQQNIMNSIKQSNNTDNSARVAESPTDERATNRSPPLSSAHHESLPQSSDPVTTREAPTRDRRRHDNNNNNNTRSSSRDPDDHAPPPSSSSLRRHKANQHRPTLAEIFTAEPTEDPEEDHHQHTPSRPSSGRPRSNSEKPRDSSLGKSSGSLRSVASSDRHIGRSPPKASPIQNPDLRRSSTASLDDAPPPSHPPSTKYQIGRRGSTASIRSTGSGHSGKSIRQPTTETIPERADDVEESPSSSAVNERMRKSTADKPPRDKDSKRGSRRDSRPTPVDPNVLHRYEHEPPSNLRSAGPSSATMQYATSTSTSFGEDRFHHPPVERERSLKSSRSYLESDPPYHGREAPYAPRDMPPSARPGPAPPPRYGGAGDDRDFVGPYPPLGHPVGPGSPFVDRDSLRGDRDRDSLREREYHSPISHKASFGSYDGGRRREWDGPPPHWDEDREARDRDSRGREYWERDRERGRDWDHQRDRERERDRELYERQHREREYPHPHSTPYSSRTAWYPTPPSSASRVAQPPHAGVGDYIPMGDIYDYDEPSPSSARAGPPAGYPNYRTGPPPPITLLPSDERDYSPRPESGRPSMPLRQPSYGRREGERRGTIDGPPDLASDAYSTRSYAHVPGAAPPPGSIPIPWSPNGGLDETPAWQNWHAEGGGRHRPPSINSNNNANANETWARSPTNPSVLSTSSGGPPHAPSSLLRPTSVAPVAEDHQRRTTERRASVKAYHGNQGHPNMNVNRPNRDVEYPEDRYSPVPIPVPPPHPPSHPHPHAPGIRNRVLLDEDREDEGFASTDSAQSHSASEEEESERDDRHHGEEDEDEDDEEEEERRCSGRRRRLKNERRMLGGRRRMLES
ncbi:hypothetical protein M413DRAFT_134208 [Hebeloma cylindrosporum]|uniref:Uncharacterized protein n=1 Tax=Hebeloma cylindrosporum TaxID=76867 RepID=A0A0C2YN42_HEBCY|nr:hypothetical protein M413DRAFT_134208 [Hebeloma cylindrosporum h7]